MICNLFALIFPPGFHLKTEKMSPQAVHNHMDVVPVACVVIEVLTQHASWTVRKIPFFGALN